MAWNALPIFADGEILTTEQMNNLLGQFHETLAGKAVVAGQIGYSTGANATAMLDVVETAVMLCNGTAPRWSVPLFGAQSNMYGIEAGLIPTWGGVRQSYLHR